MASRRDTLNDSVFRGQDIPDTPPVEGEKPIDPLYYPSIHVHSKRFRSLFTNRERFVIDCLMGGMSYVEIGIKLGNLTRFAVERILNVAAQKLPQPPRNNKLLRLVIWRAKEIGAVEAHLGLRDAEGNHIDDGVLPVAEPTEHATTPDTLILAPRLLPKRQRSIPPTAAPTDG